MNNEKNPFLNLGMQRTRELESSVAIDQTEVPRSRFFIMVKKLSRVADIVYIVDTFLIPPLHPLKKQHPKVAKFLNVQLVFDLISLFIFATHQLLLLEDGSFGKHYFKRKTKRCSKFSCSRCNANAHHPKWFKFKHSLLCLGTFCFGVYSLVKINKFFKTDQTVDLNRLLELFFWQLNAILNMKLFAFYGDHLESHSAPLDVYEDSFANKSSSGGDEV